MDAAVERLAPPPPGRVCCEALVEAPGALVRVRVVCVSVGVLGATLHWVGFSEAGGLSTVDSAGVVRQCMSVAGRKSIHYLKSDTFS